MIISLILQPFLYLSLSYFRHVVTAAHCTCSKEKHDPETNYPCLTDPSSNQIEPGKNEIIVHGGSKSREFLLNSEDALKWLVEVAHVMDGFLIDKRHEIYDIAMLKIIKLKRGSFFDPVALRDKSKLTT